MTLHSLDAVLAHVASGVALHRRVLPYFVPPGALHPALLRVIEALIETNATADSFAELADAFRAAGDSLAELGNPAGATNCALLADELRAEAEARR